MTHAEFDSLYKKEYGRMFRVCLGYASGDREKAREWTQQVFIRIWEHIANFRGDSKLSTWMYRVAVNTCLQNLRTARRRKERPLDPTLLPDSGAGEAGAGPEEPLEDRLKRVYRYAEGLTPTNRTILLLALEGVPQKEIAGITGLSHQAVRTRFHRIKADVKKQRKNESI
jgi:RNA polymerase sigma-70 factor (ECF subfamily)